MKSHYLFKKYSAMCSWTDDYVKVFGRNISFLYDKPSGTPVYCGTQRCAFHSRPVQNLALMISAQKSLSNVRFVYESRAPCGTACLHTERH